MKLLLSVSACLLLLSCSRAPEITDATPPPRASDLLAERITRIENSLQPGIWVAGESVPHYNIEQRLQELGIPGISIAFAAHGEIVWAQAYGMADVAEQQVMDTRTLLLAGSISKPVAALRALQLVEDGTFALDTNVNDYLKSWQVPDNDFTQTEKVTLRRILNHSAGLTVWGFPGYDKGDVVPSVVEVLDGKGNTDAVRVFKTPGESWLYSGGGYTVMQLMLTDTLGTSFPAAMATEVLAALGMTDSTYENPLPERLHDRAATGYRRNGNEVEGKWPIYPEMAAAGLWTTPSELIRYPLHIQQIVNGQADGVLSYAMTQTMLTPGMNDHGLGPSVTEHVFTHSGADEGFRAFMTGWKDTPYALVMMVNSDNGSIMDEVLMAVTAEYDLPGFPPLVLNRYPMSEEQLQRYVGTYSMAGSNITFSVDQGKLWAAAGYIQGRTDLVAKSETAFTFLTSGRPLEFVIEDDVVTGFTSAGALGIRIE